MQIPSPSSRALVTLCTSLALLSGCSERPSPNRLDAPVAPPFRPSDGLLQDPSLQAVVDIQNDGSVSPLLNVLYNGTPAERARAAFGMASIREVFGYQALRDQLAHPDPRVRRAVVFALSQIPRMETVTLFRAALDNEADSTVRRALVRGLGVLGDLETAEELVTGPDVDEVARVLAVGRIALRADSLSAPVLDALVDALRSADGHVREMAAWYFGRSEHTEAWADRLPDVRAVIDDVSLDDPAAAGLLRALGRVGEGIDRDRMARFLGSPDWRLRVRAAAALGSVAADDRARELLFRMLDDSSRHVAITAASSVAGLRRLRDADMDRMEGWIEANPDRWRTHVPLLEGLADQGRAGVVSSWLEERASGDLLPRVRGVGALARAPDQGVTRSLISLAASDTLALRIAALSALVERWTTDRENPELHDAYWEVFTSALASGDRGEVATVAPAMTDSVFLERGAVDTLGSAYASLTPIEDVEAALAIVEALGTSGVRRALIPLNAALSDAHLEVRSRATRYIELISRRRAFGETTATRVGRAPDWDALTGLGRHPRLVLETEKGRIWIRMVTELAPVTVQTISELAGKGAYDGTPFHRVVPDFVIQGGDVERGDGFGGPGFVIRTEITGIPFQRGVVGMANSGPDTEGSQFFVTHSAQPHLDHDYTAFGWVVEGMHVVDRILEGDRIVSARVEPDAPGP